MLAENGAKKVIEKSLNISEWVKNLSLAWNWRIWSETEEISKIRKLPHKIKKLKSDTWKRLTTVC